MGGLSQPTWQNISIQQTYLRSAEFILHGVKILEAE